MEMPQLEENLYLKLVNEIQWKNEHPLAQLVMGGCLKNKKYPLPFNIEFRHVQSDPRTEWSIPINVQACIDKIIHGYGIIESVPKRIDRVIETFLTTLILEFDDSDCPGSYSQPDLIGTSTIMNVHSSEATPWYLADALVHETIHCYLFTIEQATGDSLYYKKTKDLGLTIQSPWTGRDIEVHFFVHACFVWFGLFHFWDQYVKFNAQNRKEGVVFQQRALKGFTSTPLTQLFPDIEVPPTVRDAIQSIEDNIQLSALS